jgi:hypothetical protein
VQDCCGNLTASRLCFSYQSHLGQKVGSDFFFSLIETLCSFIYTKNRRKQNNLMLTIYRSDFHFQYSYQMVLIDASQIWTCL